MTRKVAFSRTAERQLTELAIYLQMNWSVKVKDRFLDVLDKSIKLIHNQPDIFSKSQVNKNQYRCVLSKQTTMYYKFNATEIRILAVFDTRQNPARITEIK